jgi:CheY-like chemotaxis protein
LTKCSTCLSYRRREVLGKEERGLSDEIDLGSILVLVIEDHIDAGEIVRIVLEGRGARVELSTTAHHALERLSSTRYDVIVSDIGLPDMDGYELMRELRSRGDNTPAIAVTAYAHPGHRSQALQAGFTMHLAKPLDVGELLAAVAHLSKN